MADDNKNKILYVGNARARYGFARLNANNLTSEWIQITDGSNYAQFSLLNKLDTGDSAILNGSIKIEIILGQAIREYAICDMIKNTSDLATVFYFTSAHLGKAGIICELPKNCLFRAKLEPSAGDDVIIEWTL